MNTLVLYTVLAFLFGFICGLFVYAYALRHALKTSFIYMDNDKIIIEKRPTR